MIEGLTIHRNGWNGGPVVRQQRYWKDARSPNASLSLVTVVSCGACGAAWRLETLAQAEPVISAFLDESERQEYRRDPDGFGPAHPDDHRAFLVTMASRIADGYARVAA